MAKSMTDPKSLKNIMSELIKRYGKTDYKELLMTASLIRSSLK